jgi:plastocyanin
VQEDQAKEGTYTMSKKPLALLMLCGVITLVLVACSVTGTGGTSSGGSGKQVHMNDTNFVQASLTIKKGERITLIDDSLTPHIIANGIWENGKAKPAREPGAPEVKNVQINGYSQDAIGPFTAAGTYHFYCTVHLGMNMTVVVQ